MNKDKSTECVIIEDHNLLTHPTTQPTYISIYNDLVYKIINFEKVIKDKAEDNLIDEDTRFELRRLLIEYRNNFNKTDDKR